MALFMATTRPRHTKNRANCPESFDIVQRERITDLLKIAPIGISEYYRVQIDQPGLCVGAPLSIDELFEAERDWREKHGEDPPSKALPGSYISAGNCCMLKLPEYCIVDALSRNLIVVGHHGIVRVGHGSKVVAGGNSFVSVGEDSSAEAGNNSSIIAEDMCSLKSGSYSTLRGGLHSVFCGGPHTVFVCEYFPGGGAPRHVAFGVVDGYHIKPNMWYALHNGEFKEVTK